MTAEANLKAATKVMTERNMLFEELDRLHMELRH